MAAGPLKNPQTEQMSVLVLHIHTQSVCWSHLCLSVAPQGDRGDVGPPGPEGPKVRHSLLVS